MTIRVLFAKRKTMLISNADPNAGGATNSGADPNTQTDITTSSNTRLILQRLS